jgi:hypothetical protein
MLYYRLLKIVKDLGLSLPDTRKKTGSNRLELWAILFINADEYYGTTGRAYASP